MTRGLVLCYHAVSDAWRDPLAVRESAFAYQLGSLSARGFTGSDLTDAVRGRAGAVHCTFDDAYVSVATAVELLDRFRVPATVFVITGCAGGGEPPADHAGDLRAATLSWDELRELAARGVGIGSHTVTHRHLTTLGGGELARELTDSREQIEDELRQRCRALAYPYGDTDERVCRAAAQAGYEVGLAAGAGRSGPFDAPRISVFRHDGRARFRLKTSSSGPLLFRLAAATRLRRR